jgi:pimeloyl-ACP methyl ester carboxylesterase
MAASYRAHGGGRPRSRAAHCRGEPGAAAIELAFAPERVQPLVLITLFVAASPRLLAVLYGVRLARWRAERSPDAGAVALRRRDARGRAIRHGYAAARRSRRAFRPRPCPAGRDSAWSGTRGADLTHLVADARGGGDDLLAPDAESVARAIPGAEFLRVPGAGHAVALEDHEAVNDAILAHLSRSRADVGSAGRDARSEAGRLPTAKDS